MQHPHTTYTPYTAAILLHTTLADGHHHRIRKGGGGGEGGGILQNRISLTRRLFYHYIFTDQFSLYYMENLTHTFFLFCLLLHIKDERK
jgi:hypothetical protein